MWEFLGENNGQVTHLISFFTLFNVLVTFFLVAFPFPLIY